MSIKYATIEDEVRDIFCVTCSGEDECRGHCNDFELAVAVIKLHSKRLLESIEYQFWNNTLGVIEIYPATMARLKKENE